LTSRPAQQNLATGGINKLLRHEHPQATPASKLVEQGVDLNLPLIDPGEMSNSEKLFYDANRFGTQAVGTGAMLAQRAPQVALQTSRPKPSLAGWLTPSHDRTLRRPAVRISATPSAALGAGIA
jgi:hypothetical protein